MSVSTSRVLVTLRSETNGQDARAIPPIEEGYKLDALRQKAGAWLSLDDVFLNPLNVPIERDSEPEWSVGDVWQRQSDQKTAIVLIRRAAEPPPTTITVKSVADAADLFVLPPIADPKKLTLDGLRKRIGTWLLEKDQFLSKDKVPIDRDQESQWSVAVVAADNTVLIRRDIQTVEIKIKRGDAEIASVRFASNAKLKELRGRLEARGDMAADDAFVEADGKEQVPIREEQTRSVQSALSKDKGLLITSRADWG
jgi:hypothetical protein